MSFFPKGTSVILKHVRAEKAFWYDFMNPWIHFIPFHNENHLFELLSLFSKVYCVDIDGFTGENSTKNGIECLEDDGMDEETRKNWKILLASIAREGKQLVLNIFNWEFMHRYSTLLFKEYTDAFSTTF